MTVASIYLNNDTRIATSLVRIGGVVISDVISADWSFAFQQVPSATIRVPNPTPAVAVFNQLVTIDAGFDGLMVRVFTGTVLNVNNVETGCIIEYKGKTSVL